MRQEDGRSFRKEDLRPRLMTERNDPKIYGFICPACYARYGVTQASGIIDVVRCPRCPSLAKSEQIYHQKRNDDQHSARKIRARLKQKRAGG